jgi:Arc/MetJ-type ribon-helix-helix transcriptional regulator
MTIHIPPDIESSIQAAVHSGHFASVDDAMTEAASLLLQKLKQNPQAAKPTDREIKPDPLLGSMRDAADELDEIVADAMKRRREEPRRSIPAE